MNEFERFLYSINVSVFDFIDFRDFLAQVLHHLRNQNKSLTYRKLSTEFGFKSPNFLLLLVQKKRKMSLQTAKKIAKKLNLGRYEQEYFLLMVQSTLTTDITDREQVTKKMLGLQRNRHQKNIEPQLYELYENWYQVILREIINLRQIPQTPNFLSSFFEEKITEKQALQALEKLKQLGLIEKRNNRWMNLQVNLKTGDFFSNTFIVLFHKKMLELAGKSLDQKSGNERYLSSLSLPVSESSHQKIRELIEDFKTKALEICEESPESDRVMQLNLQFFPMTKVYDEKY